MEAFEILAAGFKGAPEECSLGRLRVLSDTSGQQAGLGTRVPDKMGRPVAAHSGAWPVTRWRR